MDEKLIFVPVWWNSNNLCIVHTYLYKLGGQIWGQKIGLEIQVSWQQWEQVDGWWWLLGNHCYGDHQHHFMHYWLVSRTSTVIPESFKLLGAKWKVNSKYRKLLSSLHTCQPKNWFSNMIKTRNHNVFFFVSIINILFPFKKIQWYICAWTQCAVFEFWKWLKMSHLNFHMIFYFVIEAGATIQSS